MEMTKISVATKRKIVELRLAGCGSKEIGERFGLKYRTIDQRWRKWAEELKIDVPEGHVRRKRNFQLPQVPPAVWAMRERAVRVRLEGWNSVQAAAESGLRVQDIRINWRAWAEHLGIEVPRAMSPEELLEELREDESEEHPADETATEATTEARKEEEPMEDKKSASEQTLRLVGEVEQLLSNYLESETVSRFVLDVDGYNFCELSTGVDEELGHRCLAFEMHISIPVQSSDEL